MKPQNQVTVRSDETGLEFRINRKVAERHDSLTILDDEKVDARPARKKAAKKAAAPIKSVDKPADPIAAPVADDN